MRLLTRMLLLVLLSCVSVYAAEPALPKQGTFAADVAVFWIGKNYTMTDPHTYWSGDAKGVIINRSGKGFLHHATLLMPAAADVNGEAVDLNGYGIAADKDGDKVFIRLTMKSASGGTAKAVVEGTQGTLAIIGGTGKYKGISGKIEATYRDLSLRESGAIAEGEGIHQWQGEWKLP
jgi:hypothetical protein